MFDTSAMGRVFAEIRENGRGLWTLFDTGARRSYITRAAVGGLPSFSMPKPFRVGLGGEHRLCRETCSLHAEIEGKPVAMTAFVVDDLGKDESGRPIDVLFGAIEMQGWGIVPIPQDERIDLSRYPEEFIEF